MLLNAHLYKGWFFAGKSRHFGHNPPTGRKGRNGNKKHGRNKIKCARYRAEGRREKNKKFQV